MNLLADFFARRIRGKCLERVEEYSIIIRCELYGERFVLKGRGMRFKGKIWVILTIMMTIPVFLITFAFIIILNTKFNFEREGCSFKTQIFSQMKNPIQFMNNITEKIYAELVQYKDENPEKLKDKTYLEEVGKRLEKRYSFLYLLDKDGLYFGSNSVLYPKIQKVIENYPLSFPNVFQYYAEEDTQVLLKLIKYEEESGEVTRLYLVSNFSLLDKDTDRALMELFYSIVLSFAVTGMMLFFWVNRTLVKPINDLRISTKEIIEGNEEVSYKKGKFDEVGELYNDLNEMKKQIKTLMEKNLTNERNMREIMVNISHDLRTPLTVIQGYAMGLLEGVAKTPEKEKKYLDTICIKTNEMNSLIEELSTFAKLDMNSIPYQFKKVKIHDYIEEGIRIELTDFEIQQFDIVYKRNIPKDTVVMMDPEQIKKVMNNIISNAKKYRNKKIRGLLQISTYSEGDFVRLEVFDNGMGIKEKNLSRIFDRFYREDDSRNSKVGGSGLGLAIVKKIIQNHGGKVWAESEEGVGTKISILLKKSLRNKMEEEYE